jgi:hypothetical protein
MAKRFVLVLVVLVALLLTACSSESKDTAKDYMEAVLKGNQDKALELACESFQDQTESLLAYYPAAYPFLDTDSIDLKYDVGKGNNQKEIIVTGSFKYGADKNAANYSQEDQKEFELIEKDQTRIVLWMAKVGDDWCVSDKSEFGGVEFAAGEASEEPAAEPTAEATEAAE